MSKIRDLIIRARSQLAAGFPMKLSYEELIDADAELNDIVSVLSTWRVEVQGQLTLPAVEVAEGAE